MIKNIMMINNIISHHNDNTRGVVAFDNSASKGTCGAETVLQCGVIAHAFVVPIPLPLCSKVREY